MEGWSDEKVQHIASLSILRIEELVGNVMYLLAMAFTSIPKTPDVAMHAAAHCAQMLADAVDQTDMDVSKMLCLKDVALKRSTALYTSWLNNVKVVSAELKKQLIASVCSALIVCAQRVDGPCPRWGDYINGNGIQTELARLQLVENTS